MHALRPGGAAIVSLHYAYDKAIYGFSRGTYLHRRE
jgi:hypothetical protein